MSYLANQGFLLISHLMTCNLFVIVLCVQRTARWSREIMCFWYQNYIFARNFLDLFYHTLSYRTVCFVYRGRAEIAWAGGKAANAKPRFLPSEEREKERKCEREREKEINFNFKLRLVRYLAASLLPRPTNAGAESSARRGRQGTEAGSMSKKTKGRGRSFPALLSSVSENVNNKITTPR